MFKRFMEGWRARRFVSERERLLDSQNPVLAFAGDPQTGAQRLRPGETNEDAYTRLRGGDVRLIRVDDGRQVSAREFDRLVFVEPWDPLSAAVIGSHRKGFDAGRLGSFGIVFVSADREDLVSRVGAAWYKTVAFVLDATDPLRAAIAVVPFAAVKGRDGSLTFAEGLEGSSYRDSLP